MASRRGAKPLDSPEVCPLCKDSTYLNPNLRFMVNPECYHKMCEGCVNRNFSQGPAPCPIPGCGKTLRKHKFKIPFFEDLKLEKDRDLRLRVEPILNLQESDFETLREYNDFLELKENVIWDLNRNISVSTHEKFLATFSKEHADQISDNRNLETNQKLHLASEEVSRREKSALAREARIQELQNDKEQRESDRVSDIQRFQASLDSSLALGKSLDSNVTLKKSSAARRTPAEQMKELKLADSAAMGRNTTGVSGVRKKVVKEPEKPYDAFDGMKYVMKYFVPKESYNHAWSDKARSEIKIMAGGCDVGGYQGRAVLEAHAGLGIFVKEEKAVKAS